MRLEEFRIGAHFLLGGHRYRCTDKGSRVVVAICVDLPHEIVRLVQGVETRALTHDPSWFGGPPYPVPERVLDENDMIPCELDPTEPEQWLIDAQAFIDALPTGPIEYRVSMRSARVTKILALLAQRVRAARRQLRSAKRMGCSEEYYCGVENEAWNALQSAKSAAMDDA